MKTKLILLLLAFSLMSATCEPNAVECKCFKAFYKYDVVGWNNGNPIWNYVLEYKEPTTLTCDDASGYIPTTSGHYYRIECE